MKIKYIKYAVLAVTLVTGILFLSCGCISRPPTKVEAGLFNVVTNPPVVTVLTNVIPVTVFQTNYVAVTNKLNVVELATNVVELTAFKTNVIQITNAPTYDYTPGAGAQRIQEVGGAVGSLFGVGGLVTTGLGALFGLWAQIRSSKRYRTSANLAQSIEAVRAFLKQLPQGNSYDAAFVKWLQSHQKEGNVILQVTQLLQDEVSKPEAKDAAAEIMKIIEALQAQT